MDPEYGSYEELEKKYSFEIKNNEIGGYKPFIHVFEDRKSGI